jgi:hypothetical protein
MHAIVSNRIRPQPLVIDKFLEHFHKVPVGLCLTLPLQKVRQGTDPKIASLLIRHKQ